MAYNTGSCKRACASIYFGLAHFLSCILWKNSFIVNYLENGVR